MTTFLRLLETSPNEKGAALARAVGTWRLGNHPAGIFFADSSSLQQVPGSPFAYWVSDRIRELFVQLPALEGEGREARVGDHPADSFRYLRLKWEVPATGSRVWQDYQKGGAYSPYYFDVHLAVDWDPARSSYRGFFGRPGRSSERPSNYQYFLRPGLSWPLRTQKGLAFRATPGGCVFSHKGPTVFVRADPPDRLLSLLGVVNSTAFGALVELQMAFGSYETGVVQRAPVAELTSGTSLPLRQLAYRAWFLRRSLDSKIHTSHAFFLPALLREAGSTLAQRTDGWSTRLAETEAELARIQTEIDDIAFDLYGIDGEDRRQMEEGFGSLGSGDEGTEEAGCEDDEFDDEVEGADPVALTEALIEWTLGVALGRFDVRLATGERQPPPDSDPFDPLPVCSPGMLRDDAGLPATVAPPGYPLELPPHGILVDDPGHPWDAVSRMEAVLDLVAGEPAHGWIQEAEAILGRDLRDWLRRYGFERHLKRYSRSRRKAPLFWHLGPKSREYGLWLYSPVATRDTFYRILNDYVDPRLKGAERRLLELRQDAGSSPTGQQRKDLTTQESLVEDLRAFREEVARVAPLWRPLRDDGVVLNCAILWRLFDHHRAWQGECKKKWSELAKGQYDWAGWAVHLWPECVVKTCVSDRSIAIAHGMEEALWLEDDNGKWKPRPDGQQQVTRLTAERHSTAIQAALDDFIRAG